MRKNYVVFGSNSGRGISKTKALFDLLSQAYMGGFVHERES